MSNVSISYGNRKMGDIPSVSLPPIVTCASGCACARKCYAAKLCRIYPTVRNAYARNLDILRTDPAQYWGAVEKTVSRSRFFRFHVSGDIPDPDYLVKMIDTARKYPACDMLAFTKRYSFVNDYINAGNDIPENLHIIFSEWAGMEIENPHALPVAHVVFKGDAPASEWQMCAGNCTECAMHQAGCWTLKRGEHIAFNEH